MWYLGDSDGELTAIDARKGGSKGGAKVWSLEAHSKKVQTVDVHPRDANYVVTSSLDKESCLWDVRKMGGGKKPKPVATMPDTRSVSCGLFNPTGDRLVTVGMSNSLNLYKWDDLKRGTGSRAAHVNHNNQTGRYDGGEESA